MARVLKDKQGNEVSLFPCDVLNMTQEIGGDFSHKGSNAMDIVGRKQIKDDLYAPVTMKLVYADSSYDSGYLRVWESVDEVITPKQKGIITVIFVHDDSPPYSSIGTVVNQGQVIAHTGTSGEVTGDHSHIEASFTRYSGIGYPLRKNEYGVWTLIGSVSPLEVFYINDTEIINAFNYQWKEFDGGIIPPKPREKNDYIIWYMKRHAFISAKRR